jgi:crotonobetainyl-CoA:carnitine CoA-transferase CaiB-like acyl-CoA transferase
VVTVRGDDDWIRLGRVVGGEHLAADRRFATADGRVAHRGVLDAIVAGWTAARPPRLAMTELQAAGVPAGMMHRVPELLDALVAAGVVELPDVPEPTRSAP